MITDNHLLYDDDDDDDVCSAVWPLSTDNGRDSGEG